MTQRFRVGDAVRARAANPLRGHTRLPGYLCGRAGAIESVHGLFVLADDRALGVASERCTKQALYTVCFDAREVWGANEGGPHSICAELWDEYLEPAKAQEGAR